MQIPLQTTRLRLTSASIGHYDTASHFVTIADMTRVLFNELYDQGKEFFKDKDNDEAQ